MTAKATQTPISESDGDNAAPGEAARPEKVRGSFLRSKRLGRVVGILLIAAALGFGALTYAAFTGLPPLGDDPETLIVLLNVDIVLLLLLGLLILRRVVSI